MALIGEIRSFASGANDYVMELRHIGWIPCDGRSLNQLRLAELFRAIGTVWGTKDPENSFRVPDLQGLFMRGVMPVEPSEELKRRDPNSSDRTELHPGGARSRAVGSFQDDQLGSHNHLLHTQRFGASIPFVANAETYLGLGADNQNDTAFSGGNETRPRNVYVFYAIFAGAHDIQDSDGE